MKCEQVRAQFPDYLSGEITAAARTNIDAHLAGCGACREELGSLDAIWSKLASLPEEEPGPASEARFHAMLEAYRRGMRQGERDSSPRVTLVDWLAGLWPRQPALQFAVAIVLFAAGLLIGPSLSQRTQNNNAARGTNERALAQLREEVSSMKQMVMLSLLKQQSASERLRGVNWSYQIEQPDEQVLSALLRALDSDPNVNVRLAAVDALQQFARSTVVKRGLLDSLPRQESPLVQIELINLIVDLKEKQSVPVLKALLQNSELNKTVRERAEWGLQKLS